MSCMLGTVALGLALPPFHCWVGVPGLLNARVWKHDLTGKILALDKNTHRMKHTQHAEKMT